MNIPNAHVFTFSESYGPFMCEHSTCHRLTHTVMLTDDEYATIPDGISGDALAQFIIENHPGKNICKTCLKQLSRN